jgi:CRISPR system Cascade subunit CasA
MTNLAAATFDLIDDPWIPCLMAGGATEELSLRRVLLEAHHVRELSLDVPTQLPPVLRLMLAILHRALAQGGVSGPRKHESWSVLWDRGGLPAEPVNRYLNHWQDRFQLFHPSHPFMQAANLRTAKDETKTIALLIPFAASGNNTPLFSATRDSDPPTLTCAEAARWLLHIHAWDTAAIKTGAAGDPKVKAGKTTGNPPGPLGQLGVLIPTGETLWHTLMFNLLVLGPETSSDSDRPCWENTPLTAEWQVRHPYGLLDLYTWPSRRVRLFPELTGDGVRVRRAVVTAGDRIADVSLLTEKEPHTAWLRNEAQEKKLNRPRVFLPGRHQPGRELWRGLETILAQARANRPGSNAKGPYILDQLAEREDNLGDAQVRLLGVGISYGNKSAVIDESYADIMPLPVVLIAAHGVQRQSAALEAVRMLDGVANALAKLAADLARATGCDEDRLLDGQRRSARSRLYTALDAQFRRWMGRLAQPTTDPESALADWSQTVKAEADQVAEEIISDVPPEAMRGHEVRSGSSRTLITAPLAEIRFRAALRRALPPAAAPADQAGRPSMMTEPKAPPSPTEKPSHSPRWADVFGESLAMAGSSPAALAACRRGLGRRPLDEPAMWRYLVPALDAAPDRSRRSVEAACHHALALYATHQQSRPQPMHARRHGRHADSIGRACSDLKIEQERQGRSAEGVTRRFLATATADSVDELAGHLRGLIPQLREAAIALDYVQLARDVADWGDAVRRSRVRRRWGMDFYRARQETPHNDDTKETPDGLA